MYVTRQQFISPRRLSNRSRTTARSAIHRRHRSRSVRIGVVASLLALCLQSSRAAAQVTVVGERNPDNPGEFIWTVTNEGDQPIHMFEAPHYYGKLATPAEHWTIDEMTGNVGQGDKLAPGFVRFATDAQIAMVRRGRPKSFRLRLDPRGGHYAAGIVTVGFADGTTQKIRNVLCPAKPPFLRDYFPAIGLGVMFAIFLVGRRMLDKRRKRRSADNASAKASDAQAGVD